MSEGKTRNHRKVGPDRAEQSGPTRSGSTAAAALSRALCVMVPMVWVGIIVGISFIEAPLKFQAPEITIPRGLGIGRLVFSAMNIVEFVLVVVLTAATLIAGFPRRIRWVLGGLWLLLLAKVVWIRPLLNARTDAVLAGQDPGESWLHTGYVVVEGVLFIALILYTVWVWQALTNGVMTRARNGSTSIVP